MSSSAAAPLVAVSPVSIRLRRAVPSPCSLPTSLPMESDASCASEETHDRVLPRSVSLIIPKDVERSWSRAPDECRAALASSLGRIPKDTP